MRASTRSVPPLSNLLADRRGATSSVQMILLVSALALAGTAGVKVVRGSLEQRSECAGQQIAALSLASPCGGESGGVANSAPIFSSVAPASSSTEPVIQQPAPPSRSFGGGRFALPRPEASGFILASSRSGESAPEAGAGAIDPNAARDELVDLLVDLIGVTDAIKCLSEADIVACAQTVANFTPLRLIRLAANLNKLRRAVERFQASRRQPSREPGREIEPAFPPNNGFLGPTRREFLQPGTRIDRFGGSGFSRFFSPQGTPASGRALPPGTAGQRLRTFEVLKPLEVEAGTVAPAFGQPGGGTQFLSPVRLEILIQRGFLREILP